jgi:hypothetical protein
MQRPVGAQGLVAQPMPTVRDALIVFVTAASQTPTGATGSSAFAAGQVKRQVKPEGA